jgi:hypothetical protein
MKTASPNSDEGPPQRLQEIARIVTASGSGCGAQQAGVIPSVPELGTNLGTNFHLRKIRDGQLPENSGGQGRD